MSRPILDKHVQASVASWKSRLRAQRWGLGRIDEDVGRLATLLALDLDTPTSDPSRRAKEAVVELRAAILQTEQEAADTDAVDLLALWIRTRLLVDGDRLLISRERRRKLLAQGRDEERRQENTGRGLRSARIELPEEAWRQLGKLRVTLASVGKKHLTQNQTVALLITDRFKAISLSPSSANKTQSSKTTVQNGTPGSVPGPEAAKQRTMRGSKATRPKSKDDERQDSFSLTIPEVSMSENESLD